MFCFFVCVSAAHATGSQVTVNLTNIQIENQQVTDMHGPADKPQDEDKIDRDNTEANANLLAPVQESHTGGQPRNYSSECVSQNTMVKGSGPEDDEDDGNYRETSPFIVRAEPEQPQSDNDIATKNIALPRNLMKTEGDRIV